MRTGAKHLGIQYSYILDTFVIKVDEWLTLWININ